MRARRSGCRANVKSSTLGCRVKCVRRAGKWLGCLLLVMLFPMLALSVLIPTDSPVATSLGWLFAVIFWPGPLVMAIVYLAIRAVRHRRIHAKFDPCPWCQRSAEYHSVPRETREARDRLRERLNRSEMHVD